MPIVIVKGSHLNNSSYNVIEKKKGYKSSSDDDDSDCENEKRENNTDMKTDKLNNNDDNDNYDNNDNNDRDESEIIKDTINSKKHSKNSIKSKPNITNGVYFSNDEDLTDLLTLRVYKISRPSLFEVKHIEAKLIGDGIFIDVEKKEEDEIILRQSSADYDDTRRQQEEKLNSKKYDTYLNYINNDSNKNKINDDNNDNHSNNNATVIQRIRLLQNKFGKISFNEKNAIKEKIKESEQRKHFTSVGQSLLGIIEENTVSDIIKHAIEFSNRNESTIPYQILSLDEEVNSYKENKKLKSNRKSSAKNEENENKKFLSKGDIYQHTDLDLGQQLDKACHDQLASFLASITFNSSQRQFSATSINSFSKKNSRISSSKTSMIKTKDPHPPSSPIPSRARGRSSVAINSKTKKNCKSPERSNSPKRSVSPLKNFNPDQEIKYDIIVSNDGETLLTKIKNDQVQQPESLLNHSNKRPPVYKQKARKVNIEARKVYGNAESMDGTHITAASLKAIEDAKKIQEAYNKRMKGILTEFQNIGENFVDKTKQVNKKVNRANKVSAKVVNNWSDFNKLEIEEQKKIVALSEDIDFNRPQDTKWKYQCLVNGDGFQAKSSHALYAIIQAERDAKVKQEDFKYDNLSNNSWLLTYISKLRDYAKRKMHLIPLSCFKFLSVFEQLIAAGIQLDVDLFYKVLESVFTDNDDYAKSIVNKTIKAVRDFIKIPPDRFLKYLNERNITPCPELVKHVKDLEKKRIRKNKIAEQQKAKLHALRELNKSNAESSRPNSGQGDKSSLVRGISFSRPGSAQRSESRSNLIRNSSKISMASESEFNMSDWGDSELMSEWGLESRDDDASVYDDF